MKAALAGRHLPKTEISLSDACEDSDLASLVTPKFMF